MSRKFCVTAKIKHKCQRDFVQAGVTNNFQATANSILTSDPKSIIGALSLPCLSRNNKVKVASPWRKNFRQVKTLQF